MRSVMSCFLSVPSLCRWWGRVGMLAGGVSLACMGLARADDSGNLTLQLLDRVNALEDQTRQMRGQIDQLTNQVQQQNATLSKQVEDMNFAMQHGHAGTGAATTMAAPAAAAAVAAPAASKRTPDDVLKAGNEALLKQDYATAQADAQQVLSGPRSPRQVDAQYLLAQSLAGQKQYRQSALAYYDAYNRAPHGQRAPSALLGVAATLVALNDRASACQALDKLSSEFPEPAARIKSAEQVYRKRAKCN
ncbi:hypothetical protein LU298_17000 [Komagataeibacter intermedius]|uniref:Uncharacterized protein n=2 Tax=Komagataeibacter intermedius TaxID=66229 RepID=A0A0N1F911_9PROT|nr:hypothetical protein [Komagataeibacter intermedius]KPH85128.1 hypothetical protein GLUCOINTEAF2_0201283 [Komagataeibacter intermedius AF2]MCF3638162.1 hypothetical protein [Komagataeibacter intermedius]